MKKTIVVFSALAMLAGYQAAFGGGWASKESKITGYFMTTDGAAVFRVADMENPDSCVGPGYLFISQSAPHFKEMYATVMAASATDKTVQVSYSGCSGGGTAGYPLVNQIAVPKIW